MSDLLVGLAYAAFFLAAGSYGEFVLMRRHIAAGHPQRGGIVGIVSALLIIIGVVFTVSAVRTYSPSSQQTTTAAAVAPTASPKPDAGAGAADCPLAQEQCTAFTTACAQLAAATPETIATTLPAAAQALGQVLEQQRWIRERYLVFERHKFEGLFAACGIADDRALVLLRLVADAAKREDAQQGKRLLTDALRGDRESLCASAALHSEVGSGKEWTFEQRTTWLARCQTLLASGPDEAYPTQRSSPRSAPAAVASAIASEATDDPAQPEAVPASPPKPTSGCDRVRASHAPGSMAPEERNGAPWVAYGIALARCTPSDAPWATPAIAMDQDAWTTTYVLAFVNLDLGRAPPFQQEHPQEYGRILKNWNLE